MGTPLGASVPLWFAPLGRSPAVDLLRDSAGLAESQILSLGRADLASLLYTTASLASDQKFTITLAHAERGIVARNVLLSVAIALPPPLGDPDWCWRLYHNIYIYRTDLLYLRELLEHLFSCLESPASWAKVAKSSKFLKFTNTSTMEQLRKVFGAWLVFLNSELGQTPDLEESQAERFSFMKTFNHQRQAPATKPVTCAGVEAAGAHFVDATLSFTKAYDNFCKTGAVEADKVPDKYDWDETCAKNPLMLQSCSYDEQFLDLSTDPLQSFHLAEAFDLTSAPSPADLVDIARAQFREWASAFRNAVGPDERRVQLTFHHGDELAFCNKLHSANGLPLYSGPQVIKELETDLDAGKTLVDTLFDVIDTAELPESRGLLATVVAARPLVNDSPHSVLYTSIKTQCYLDPLPGLKEMLCEDLTTFFTLFGMAPVGYVLGNSTTTASHEAWIGKPPCKESVFIPWKLTVSGDVPAERYDEAFVPVVTTPYDVVANLVSSMLLSTSSVEPGRLSFTTLPTAAMLLRYLKTKTLLVGWSAVIAAVIRTAQDSGAPRIVAEIEAWLALAGLDNTKIQEESQGAYFLTMEILKSFLPTFLTSSDLKRYLMQLCVFILDDKEDLEATFSSILAAWSEPTHNDKDQASLVVCFAVPKAIIDTIAEQRSVLVALRNTSETMQRFKDELGSNLIIFTTNMRELKVSRRPYMFRDRKARLTKPLNLRRDLENAWDLVRLTPGETTRRAAYHISIPKDSIEFSYDMISPCTVEITCKNEENKTITQLVATPFPALPDHDKDRNIEEDSKTGKPRTVINIKLTERSMTSLTPFPVVNYTGDRLAWGLPSVSLDALPRIPRAAVRKAWFTRTFSLALSTEENVRFRTLSNNQNALRDDELPLRWKVTFSIMVIRYMEAPLGATMTPPRPRVGRDLWALALNGRRPYALVLPLAVRHDTASASFVLDALVVTDLKGPREPNLLVKNRLLHAQAVIWQPLEEVSYTIALLNASAERARRGIWRHGNRCAATADPITKMCSCGDGKTPRDMIDDPDLRFLASKGTRVAFGVIFPVPYVMAVRLPQMAL